MRQFAQKLGKRGLCVFPSFSLLMAKEAGKDAANNCTEEMDARGSPLFWGVECGGWAAVFNKDVISGGR